MIFAVVPARRHYPTILLIEVALLRFWNGVLVPRVTLIHRIAQWIVPDENLFPFPVFIVGVPKQNTNPQVDLDKIRRYQFSVHDNTRGHEHLAAPFRHVAIVKVAVLRVLQAAPTTKQNAAISYLFVAGHGFIEKIEKIVMHRDDALHEFYVPLSAGQIICEQLDRRHGADAAWVKRRGMNMPSFHETKHLTCHAAYLQSLAVKFAFERIKRFHNVADGVVAMSTRLRSLSFSGFLPDTGIGLAHHLLAEVDTDQVFLKDVVVKHVLRRLAQIDDPLSEMRRLDAIGHILRIARARGVIIPADSADSASNKMRIARILAFHKNAVAAKDR